MKRAILLGDALGALRDDLAVQDLGLGLLDHLLERGGVHAVDDGLQFIGT